jgi:hypothetical protein
VAAGDGDTFCGAGDGHWDGSTVSVTPGADARDSMKTAVTTSFSIDVCIEHLVSIVLSINHYKKGLYAEQGLVNNWIIIQLQCEVNTPSLAHMSGPPVSGTDS